MSGANGAAVVNGGAALAALPVATEAPASVTVRLPYRGRDVMLTLRGATGGDVLGRLDAALTWLEEHGLTTPATPGPTPAAIASEAPPTCPVHGRPMAPGKRGGWYCPARVAADDGTGKPAYCRHRIGGAS